MEIFTPNQELLIEYLWLVKMPPAQGMLIVGILWEEQAIQEMLNYIATTQEDDPAKLYSIACEISQKYKSDTEEYETEE